mmetsp:Transcript_93259/g.216744  ORF Transcript_93259/g.216744 Transcript_93259/m.216744 type:complete len:293 (-) Transcript_93259:96-974(-)
MAAVFTHDPSLATMDGDTEEDTATPRPHACNLKRGHVALSVVALAIVGLAGADLFSTRGMRTPASSHRPEEAVVLAEEAEEPKPVFKPCLCVFDIDRTLTGKQGWKDKCPEDLELGGVQDMAYAQGTMVVSELAQSIGKTFCGECYHGIVTAGVASGEGSAERQRLLSYLGGTERTRSDFWHDIHFNADTSVTSSLVVEAQDTLKQKSVLSMIEWWRNKQDIPLKNEDVYFFDDIKENVLPFKGTGINARQVSCAVRGPSEMAGAYDGKIGGCGGAFVEIEKVKGVHICDEK